MFLDTITQGVPRFCQNIKGTIFLQGIWCYLLPQYSGEEEAREMCDILCQYPAAMLCFQWCHLGREYLFCIVFGPSFPKRFWKGTACPLELIIRGLSSSSLQTWQSEKYAQSYLLQNLWTSQISVQMKKRLLTVSIFPGSRPNLIWPAHSPSEKQSSIPSLYNY